MVPVTDGLQRSHRVSPASGRQYRRGFSRPARGGVREPPRRRNGRLIERFGGMPSVSPSMREVPLAENREAIDFANRVISGQIDIVIFMTGVGMRHLVAEIERHVDRERFLAALSDVTTVARGPKPVAVLKELGIDADLVACPSRTPGAKCWPRSIATAAGRANRRSACRNTASPTPAWSPGSKLAAHACESTQGLRWDLPSRTSARWKRTARIAAGEIDVAHVHVGPPGRQRAAHGRAAGVGGRAARDMAAWSSPRSVRPRAKCCASCELPVDIEPEHSKMGHLVAAPRAEKAAADQPAEAGERRRRQA